MLIILSPAKTMDMKTLGDTYPFTWPLFQQDADLLVGKMQQYGVEELQKLLKVSKSLAEENYIYHFRGRQIILVWNRGVSFL